MKRGNKKKFGLERNQRKALYKSLATALIDNGRIKTTVVKAKSLSSFMDKAVTGAKRQSLAARRKLNTQLGVKAASKLFKEIAPGLKDRNGGYTRVIKLGQRKSDGAPMALIEFLARAEDSPEVKVK